MTTDPSEGFHCGMLLTPASVTAVGGNGARCAWAALQTQVLRDFKGSRNFWFKKICVFVSSNRGPLTVSFNRYPWTPPGAGDHARPAGHDQPPRGLRLDEAQLFITITIIIIIIIMIIAIVANVYIYIYI